jgi:hypothetical protein
MIAVLLAALVWASAAPTVQTPMPERPAIPPVRTRSGIKPIYLVLVFVLLFAAAAGALAVLNPVEMFKRITNSRDTTPLQTTTTTTSAAVIPAPSQTTITATPEPVITETTAPVTTTTAVAPPPQQIVEVEEERPPIAPRRKGTQPVQVPADELEAEPAPLQSRVRSIAVYVDGPGSVGANERAISRLRDELRGVERVALHAGALQVQVYRAIHRYIPALEFDEESEVVITFDSTPQRLSLDKHDLSARASIEKNGRAIFRYELPRHYDRSQAPDAFARTLAEAMSE